jgi:outer membrane protein
MSIENTSNQETTQTVNENVPARSKIANGTIINVVLFLGLIVLYVFNFWPPTKNDAKTPVTEELNELSQIIDDGSFNIAYVDSDSLMARYTLAAKLREELEAEQRRLENDLQRKQLSFQEDVESFQRQIQLGMITAENGQVKEQELMQRQQDLIQLNDTYTNQLMMRELEMNTELYGKITDILERYNQDMNYDYILGFTPGGGILYANKKHNITEEIVSRLNKEQDASN